MSVRRKISGVHVINPNKAKTRSVEADSMAVECDAMLYLFDFEDDSGFAILAADDRISSDIITIAEEGSLSEENLYDAFSGDEEVMEPDFPVDGPGIIESFENDTCELFLNPNTFDLYDSTSADYFVGDYYPGEADSTGESMTEMSKKFISNLVVSYSIREIKSATAMVPIDSLIDDDRPSKDYVITIPSTSYEGKVAGLLAFSKDWHQRSPFNDFCPKVRQIFKPWKRHRAYCGCVNIAVGAMLANEEWPATITYDGNTVDWKSLKSNYNQGNSAAALMRALGKKLSSMYFYNGTFTLPIMAKSYLSKHFSDVHYSWYDINNVTSSLDRGKSIFICSIPNKKVWVFNTYDIANSHAWNIDGYKLKTVTTLENRYSGVTNELLSSKVKFVKTTCMVHCNFGWGGSFNGYFASGVFDLGNKEAEFDDISQKKRQD